MPILCFNFFSIIMSRGFSKIQKNIRLGIIMTLGIFVSWALFPTNASAETDFKDDSGCQAATGGMCLFDPVEPYVIDAGNCSSMMGKRCYKTRSGEDELTDDQCKAKNPSASCLSGTCSGTSYGACKDAGGVKRTCCLPANESLTEKDCNAKNPKGECTAKSPGNGYVNLGRCVDKAGTNCWQAPANLGLDKKACEALSPKGQCAGTSPGTGYTDKGKCTDVPGTICWQAPASGGGECSSKGGSCSPEATCTGDKFPTTDCSGPVSGGGNLTCCVPKGGGDGPGGSTETISFPNPLKFDTFQDFVMGILAYLQGIIVLLAVVFIVIGGVLYLISGGNEGWIKTAKAAITAAMIGLAIGIGAPTFLREIVTILCTTGGGSAISCPIDQAPIAGAISLWQILVNTLNFLLGITGVLGVIMFVIGGGMYLTSAGKDAQIDTGKDIIKYSLIGIIVVLAALIIVKQIATLFV